MRSAYDRTLASLKRQHGGIFNPDVHKVKEIRKQTANYAGRPLKLGDLDAKVMEERKKVRQSGGVLNGLVLRAIATAVIRMKAPEDQRSWKRMDQLNVLKIRLFNEICSDW